MAHVEICSGCHKKYTEEIVGKLNRDLIFTGNTFNNLHIKTEPRKQLHIRAKGKFKS